MNEKMTDRERLLDILSKPIFPYDLVDPTEAVADYLLDNGVTFAKDMDVPSKWVSVEDGLPELVPCGAGTAYSEAVNVLTENRKVLTAVWNGTVFIGDAAFWGAEDEEITHWTPVLLPLPAPPGGA